MDNYYQSNSTDSAQGLVNLSDKSIKDSDNIFESLSKYKEITNVRSIYIFNHSS